MAKLKAFKARHRSRHATISQALQRAELKHKEEEEQIQQHSYTLKHIVPR